VTQKSNNNIDKIQVFSLRSLRNCVGSHTWPGLALDYSLVQ